MSNLVVFQWGRLGDLVQTGIVLSRWRAQFGGSISLVYDNRYRDVVDPMLNIDDGIPIDIQQLVESTRGNGSQRDTLATLNEIVCNSPSLHGGAHLVLSRSSSAALLSHLLEPDRELGYTWTQGELQVPRLLNDYLNETGSSPYPIHLCDVWSMLVDLECTPAGSCNRSYSPDSSKRILLFADAGEAYRTPPVKWLTDLSEALVRGLGYKLTFVGSKHGLDDDPISQLCATQRDCAHDTRGRTCLKDLIELCLNHEIVIGSDTGGLHLAAACGCRPIGLYFGGANVHNTGPYCEQAAVLQNPVWTNTELETVVHLIQDEDTLSDLRVWRPAWDAGGLTYINAGQSSLEIELIRNARNIFLNKWMKPYQSKRRLLETKQSC